MNVTIAAVNGAGQGNISIIIIDLNEYEEGNKLSIIINYYNMVLFIKYKVFKTDHIEIFRKGIKWSVRVWIYVSL